MIVFNLTDVETPVLKAAGVKPVTLVIGSVIIQPGCSAEVPSIPMTRTLATKAVSEGLLAVDSLPPAYAMLKSRLQQGRRVKPQMSQVPVKRKPRVWTSQRKAV